MKKLCLILAMLFLGLALTISNAFAFSLNYGGEVQFHFVNWDIGTLWSPAGGATNWKTGTPTLGDGKEDSWGVASISTITKPPSHDPSNPADLLWSNIGSGESLEAHFYGLDDVIFSASVGVSTTTAHIDSATVAGGAFIDLYLDKTGAYGIPLNPYVEGTYPADKGLVIDGATHNVGNITDGELLLRLEFLPYYGSGIVYATDYAFNNANGSFVYGSGAAYLKAVGGSMKDAFDQNYYNSEYPDADVYFTDQYDVNANPGNWLLKTTGIATSAVPEPTSMFLFGMGMLGLAATKMRRKKAA